MRNKIIILLTGILGINYALAAIGDGIKLPTGAQNKITNNMTITIKDQLGTITDKWFIEKPINGKSGPNNIWWHGDSTINYSFDTNKNLSKENDPISSIIISKADGSNQLCEIDLHKLEAYTEIQEIHIYMKDANIGNGTTRQWCEVWVRDTVTHTGDKNEWHMDDISNTNFKKNHRDYDSGHPPAP